MVNITDSEIGDIGKHYTYTPHQTVKFDGHEFSYSLTREFIWSLYLAKKAKLGDVYAKELLDTFNVEIYDTHGNIYYGGGIYET